MSQSMYCKCDKKKKPYYTYYDTPEGCDIEKKMLVTARYGIITGLIMSSYDVLMYSQAVRFKAVMKRYMFHTVPLGLMGATFALVANGAQILRDKNDRLNYFLGGLACGPIVAPYVGSYHAVLIGGLILGVIGMVKKDGVDSGHVFLPEVTNHMNTIRSWRHDFSLARDPLDDLKHSCGK